MPLLVTFLIDAALSWLQEIVRNLQLANRWGMKWIKPLLILVIILYLVVLSRFTPYPTPFLLVRQALRKLGL